MFPSLRTFPLTALSHVPHAWVFLVHCCNFFGLAQHLEYDGYTKEIWEIDNGIAWVNGESLVDIPGGTLFHQLGSTYEICSVKGNDQCNLSGVYIRLCE